MRSPLPPVTSEFLRRGLVIPAMPLALTAERRLDERRQRALCRYYLAAGAGGLAVAVHTTQFAIRDPRHGLLRPVLALAAEEMDRVDPLRAGIPVRIAGICGRTAQAVAEAEQARDLGYHAGLLSLAALADEDDDARLAHCRAVAAVLPLFGFYLQQAVGGPALSYQFWRRFAEIENVVGIKIAPFNRYQTLDVIRAVAEAGRRDIALYTGNDDNIVLDLLTPYRFTINGQTVERRIVGGLLGHWAVWTRGAVELLRRCQEAARSGVIPSELLQQAAEVTDANAAFFDAAHGFAGCIAGLHAVLRRQGLFEGIWCLDPRETLSPGQAEEIERVYRAYPHWNDDAFVAAHRDEWLRP
ncbi:MAG: dihydrodipicolinate synthase family protein [Isosphaeraceae bacterium]|nr:dihydrodipicolinate synthase family protein [Isosphaeraceae bacterium]